MALDNNKMKAAIAGGQLIPIFKSNIINTNAGFICSMWRALGSPLWPQGAIPGAAAICNDNTVGGIVLPPFGDNTGRIYRFAPLAFVPSTFMAYERLAHMGGLNGTLLTAQTVNLNPASAIAAGRATELQVEWWLEIYNDIGTTASNLVVTYTDVNDVPAKTVTITGFTGASPLNRSGRCLQIVPADGVQIKTIQSVTLSASSGTAGNFGITARKKLTTVGQILANVLSPSVDAVSIGMPEFKDSACLEMLVICTTTSTGNILGDLVWGQVNEA